MFLKVLRGIFIGAGLLVLAGSIIAALDVDDDMRMSGQLPPQPSNWQCQAVGTSGKSNCHFTSPNSNRSISLDGSGPDVADASTALTMGLLGVGLIGAAIALGQFQRPAQPAAATGQPAVAAGPQPQPMQPMQHQPMQQQYPMQGQQMGTGPQPYPPGNPPQRGPE